MISDNRRPGHEISKPIPFVSVKVALCLNLLNSKFHIFSLFLEVLQLSRVFLLDRLPLPSMASRGFCIALPFFIRLSRGLGIVYMDRDRPVASRKRHESLLPITTHNLCTQTGAAKGVCPTCLGRGGETRSSRGRERPGATV